MTQAEQKRDEHESAAQTEIERLTQELNCERDRHLRVLADFDNYRKRVQRERESAAQAGKRQYDPDSGTLTFTPQTSEAEEEAVAAREA